MLRPAILLPPKRLLTPRSGPGISPRDLGSATGRSGAYPDGTLTRWNGAARSYARYRSLCFFRTHHNSDHTHYSTRRKP